jgi:hypothetical protein
MADTQIHANSVVCPSGRCSAAPSHPSSVPVRHLSAVSSSNTPYGLPPPHVRPRAASRLLACMSGRVRAVGLGNGVLVLIFDGVIRPPGSSRKSSHAETGVTPRFFLRPPRRNLEHQCTTRTPRDFWGGDAELVVIGDRRHTGVWRPSSSPSHEPRSKHTQAHVATSHPRQILGSTLSNKPSISAALLSTTFNDNNNNLGNDPVP